MTKTLFIGLDGATFTILDHLTRERPGQKAVMPFLKHLMDTGFRSVLRSTALPLTPPAWVTVMTGRNPGNHGVFDFMRTKDLGNDVFFTLNEFRDIQVETIWSIMSRQQRSVVSLNFPMMAPPPEINGSLIPGFIHWKHLRRNMTPATLYERLKTIPDLNVREIAWDFARENEVGLEMEGAYLEKYIDYHLPREEQWFQIAAMLLREDRPDFMSVMFDGVDKIQHQAWQYLDPTSKPDMSDPSASKIQSMSLEYFRKLDGYIKNLVTMAGKNVRVFLASDHGFSATHEVLRINRYLGDLGYLTWPAEPTMASGRRREASPFAYLDWQHTIAYCPTPSSNGIVIRVARKPGQPGIEPRDYEKFRGNLIKQLYEIKDPTTGESIITKIMTREEAFSGTAMEKAPDLTLELRDSGFVSIKNREPVLAQRHFPMGTHHPEGIFIAWGAGIKSGGEKTQMEIANLAATFLHSVGLAIPEDLDGRAIIPCFTDEYLVNEPVKIGPPTLPVQDGVLHEELSYSEEDNAEIIQRLKMLGYLE